MSTPDGPVYPHGVEVSVALSSSVRSDHDVVVRDATLEVEKFEPGRREDLDYVSIKRRDLMEVRAFEVELDGATVLPAVLKTGDRTLRSRSTNILDFETPRALRLSKLAGSTEELSLRLAPTKVGFYVVRLRLRFRVGADDQELLTGPLRIYYAGAE